MSKSSAGSLLEWRKVLDIQNKDPFWNNVPFRASGMAYADSWQPIVEGLK